MMKLYKLMRGTESSELMEILLQGTRIRCKKTKEALSRVFVNGLGSHSPESAAHMLNLDKRSLYRSINRLNVVYERHEKYTALRNSTQLRKDK
jgi:hypothetical protein